MLAFSRCDLASSQPIAFETSLPASQLHITMRQTAIRSTGALLLSAQPQEKLRAVLTWSASQNLHALRDETFLLAQDARVTTLDGWRTWLQADAPVEQDSVCLPGSTQQPWPPQGRRTDCRRSWTGEAALASIAALAIGAG